ncbi:MAG TPA: glycosyltransferase family 1 protein [Candidatus Fraserbacteria bacterium]|nr:glycosyltransferase family 1 protein [Candidatus Fraserbacteria bacterium]
MREICRQESSATPKPKVLHLITRLLRGGAEAKTLAELAALRDKYDFTLGYGAEFSPEQLAKVSGLGVPTYRFSLMRHFQPLSLALAGLQLYRYLRSERFDIVHTHETEAGIVGRHAAHRAGVPLIVHTIHGIPFTEQRNPMLRRFLLLLERRVAPWTTRLIANADAITRDFLRAGVGVPAQYVTIHSGVDLEHYSSAKPLDLGLPTGAFKLLTAARLTPGKGFSELLQAAAQLASESRPIVWLIAGEGPLRPWLERKIRERNLNWVRLLGYQSDLAPLMASVDCFVLPSYREGTPRTISEAMAAGLPVIATRIDGIPEQVEEGVNGLLIEPRQTEPLAEAIRRLACDGPLCRRMGRAGRERAKAFSLSVMIAQLDRLYQELLGR